MVIHNKDKSPRTRIFAFSTQVAKHIGEQMSVRCVISENRRESAEFPQRCRVGARLRDGVEADIANELRFKS